jgi:hypothetical protein
VSRLDPVTVHVILPLYPAVAAHRIVRRRGPHIFHTKDPQVAVRLSALRTGRPLLRRTFLVHVRFEVFTAVSVKNGVFWDVTPCGSCKNRRLGGT